MESIKKLRRVAEEQSSPVACKLVRVYTDMDGMSASNAQVAEALGNAIDEIEHELEERYMLLPTDADGVLIRLGDVMECFGAWEGNSPFEVRAMWLGEGGWELYDRLGDRCHPSITRHHHEPTVEDVLFSYGQKCIRAADEAVTDAAKQKMLASLRTEYAARLRLAGDAE